MNASSKKTLLFWSSGKDACLALYRLRQDPQVEVVSLVSTFQEGSGKVAFHGTELGILKAQAASLSIPIELVPVPEKCSNKEYEQKLSEVLKPYLDKNVTSLAFGDLFLGDIRTYREQFLNPLGFELLFPLWKENTYQLAEEFITLGYQAVVTGINRNYLSESFLGQAFSSSFIKALPPGVDPCGENGEFHTLVHGGPQFKHSIPFSFGRIQSEQDHFWIETRCSI